MTWVLSAPGGGDGELMGMGIAGGPKVVPIRAGGGVEGGRPLGGAGGWTAPKGVEGGPKPSASGMAGGRMEGGRGRLRWVVSS